MKAGEKNAQTKIIVGNLIFKLDLLLTRQSQKTKQKIFFLSKQDCFQLFVFVSRSVDLTLIMKQYRLKTIIFLTK